MTPKLPHIQFYVGDWRKDPGVQALDYFDRGVWFEILCLMHESDERGRLVLNGRPMPPPAVARLLGIPIDRWKEVRDRLVAYGVAEEDDEGALINRRMVRDEEIRKKRAEAGRKGGKRSRPPKEAKTKQTGSNGGSKSEEGKAAPDKDNPANDESDGEAKGKQNGTLSLSMSLSESDESSSLRSESTSHVSAAVGVFLKRTESTWRLQTPIDEWATEIRREKKYAGADIPYEIRKCADWYAGRNKTPKAPDLSIRNWLEKAGEAAQEKPKRRPDRGPRSLHSPLPGAPR